MPGMIRLVDDIWLTLTKDASETWYLEAMPLNVSPARTTWVALERLDGGAGAGAGAGDIEVLVAPLGRLSCMPGMIRLVVDIWLTSTSDASETRWRLAIPIRVSPQRTSYVSLTSATGEEAGVLADVAGDVAGAGAGAGDVEVLVALLGRLSCMPGMIRLVVDIWLTSTSDASETRWRLAMPIRVSPQRTPYVSPTRTAGDELGVLADDAVPPADEEMSSSWPGRIRLVSLRLLERSKSDSRMPDLEAMPIRVSPLATT